MIRALIVDDEAPARARIRQLLAQEPDVSVVGEAANSDEALRLARLHAPDLLFLDVQMPGRNGLELLDELGDGAPESIIFVTAYDQYAVRAFDHHAADYLLKPFDPDRFSEAISRVRNALRRDEAHPPDRVDFGDRIAVRSGARVVLLRPEDIDWIDAHGNYVMIHAAGERHLLREKISGMELRLDPRRFARIHRSTIVNIDRIRDLHPLFHGEYTVILTTGDRLSLSRRYRERLQARWGRAL